MKILDTLTIMVGKTLEYLPMMIGMIIFTVIYLIPIFVMWMVFFGPIGAIMFTYIAYLVIKDAGEDKSRDNWGEP